jgi:hypothetical protein
MPDSDSTSLAESFSHMARPRLRGQNRQQVLDALLRLAVAVVPDAQTSSVTVRATTKMRTLRARDDRALSLGESQYRAKCGPCVGAACRSANLYI